MKQALADLFVVDLSVNAPGPFATMMLADLGARVVSIENPVSGAPAYAGAADDPMLAGRGGAFDALSRGKHRWPLNLKSEVDLGELLELLKQADVLVSEMRPGKLELLGLGWERLHRLNPRMILCEISGYGSRATNATRAGHDINYMALSGALSLIRDQAGKPVVPQNVLGDYAAGGALAVSAILAALLQRERTGQGQRLDISMTAGISYLMSDIAAATVLAGHAESTWRDTLNGGMPTYDTYRTADGRWIAVGALEPKFIAIIAEVLKWPELPDLMTRKETWDQARLGLTKRFSSKTRDEWSVQFGNTDGCVTPVYSLDEMPAGKLPSFSDVTGI